MRIGPYPAHPPHGGPGTLRTGGPFGFPARSQRHVRIPDLRTVMRARPARGRVGGRYRGITAGEPRRGVVRQLARGNISAEMLNDAAGGGGGRCGRRGRGHGEHGCRPVPHVPPRRRQGCPTRVGVRAGRQLGPGPGPWAGRQAAGGRLHSQADPRPVGLADQHGSALGVRILGGSRLRHCGRLPAPASSAVRPALRRGGVGTRVPGAARGRAVPADPGVRREDLARDLGAHLAYGAGTGGAFWLLARAGSR